ncbi:MAG: hypothetical protein KDD29_08415 [Flavobacteriales bacterium]|nr:hypothetical protein [Flavobacteriales bacterium]MCB9334983.1 hypothetical protein [Flavobacteriales bacterium]
MIRKDYIQRYFDELAKVLAAVLQLKQRQEPENAEEKLDEFGHNFLNINLNELVENNAHNFLSTLIEKHQFEIVQIKLIEELLYHKYLLNPLNKPLKNCTLEVLNYLAKNDSDFSWERQNRIDQLNSSN